MPTAMNICYPYCNILCASIHNIREYIQNVATRIATNLYKPAYKLPPDACKPVFIKAVPRVHIETSFSIPQSTLYRSQFHHTNEAMLQVQ